MATTLDVINDNAINEKLLKVKSLLEGKSAIVAYSGGVDSSVVAYLAKLYATDVLLVMQTGASVAIGEKEIAKKQADRLKLPIEFIEYDEVDYSDNYAENPDNRCFYCKELLYDFLEEIREQKDFDLILSGTNYSDLGGHRPGHQAAEDAGVLNPLATAKITKPEVRWIANEGNLQVWDKPASACLASRFITGVPITKEGLQRVAQAEHYIKTNYPVRVLRVRDHGSLARIEFGKDELSQFLKTEILDDISSKLKELGFNYVSLDMQGYSPAVPPSFQKENQK